MNTRVFAVAALLCAPIYGKAPKGISTISLDGQEFEWSKQEETYLNKNGQKRDKLMLEEYARPKLGDFDEDLGILVLDFRKVLIDNNNKLKKQEEVLMDKNSKLEEQEEVLMDKNGKLEEQKKVLMVNESQLSQLKEKERALELYGDQRLNHAIEHNIQRERIIDEVPDLLRTWELDTIGPQPYNFVAKFTAKVDIERNLLPDNMIASPGFDFGEYLYPIKAGEECWRIQSFGHPWYYCPDSQVKEGCKETFEDGNNPYFSSSEWLLQCDNGDRIRYHHLFNTHEDMSLFAYSAELGVSLVDSGTIMHSFYGKVNDKMNYQTRDLIHGDQWSQYCTKDDSVCPDVEHETINE